MKANKWIFKAEPWGDRWFPNGETEDKSDEVWCDGCCIADKHLADMIANNMHASFKKGWEEAMKYVATQLQNKCDVTWERE